MGHYDDILEEDYAEERRKRAEDLTRWIKEGIDELELDELEDTYYYIQHISDYQAFMRVARGRAHRHIPRSNEEE